VRAEEKLLLAREAWQRLARRGQREYHSTEDRMRLGEAFTWDKEMKRLDRSLERLESLKEELEGMKAGFRVYCWPPNKVIGSATSIPFFCSVAGAKSPSVRLLYRYDPSEDFAMVRASHGDGGYYATIPAEEVREGVLEFQFEAQDGDWTETWPPGGTASTQVVSEEELAKISPALETTYDPKKRRVTARIEDRHGMAAVTLHVYRLPEGTPGEWEAIPMSERSSSRYEASVPEGDCVWWVEAENIMGYTSRDPAEGRSYEWACP
jgi:hypothetical protein